jgi:(5-formylfuran-3-yl)methyl phosphate synthase
MTGMLASINSLVEAKLVLAEGVDIIDLKEPANGALGALDVGVVKEIVDFVHGQCPISATIGDLPMQPPVIFNAVQAMSETGVDYIKIGFFPSETNQQVIAKLAQLSPHIKLIAVLFADAKPDFSLIDDLKIAGFTGVMLDTMDKTKGSLTTIMPKTGIDHFAGHVKTKQLIFGLAGSLKLESIPLLIPYRPDYLGFRGALCDQHDRVGQLNSQAVQKIKQAMVKFSC